MVKSAIPEEPAAGPPAGGRGGAGSPGGGGTGAPRRRSPLGIIFMTLFLDLAGFSIIFPLSPSLLEYYLKVEGRDGLLGGLIRTIEAWSPLAASGGDPVYTAALFGGVLGAVYSLLQFLFAPVWGSLSDRIGRRPVLLLSIAGVAASYALWAASKSFMPFIVARFIGGAMAGNISVATAAAADVSPREHRARAMGIVGAAFGLGFIFGPAIGGILGTIDLTDAGRFPSLAPTLVSFGFNPFSAAALGAFVLSALNLLWVATRFQETLTPGLRPEKVERTINPLRFFQRFDLPGVRATNFVYFLYLLAFAGMEFTLTFLARERLHYGPRDNMYMFVFVGLIMALVQGGLVRRLVPRLGERRVAAAGLFLVLPGFILLGLARSPGLLYGGLAFMAVGSGLVQPSITSLVSLYTPPDRQGAVLGIFRSLGAFARVVGPLLATVLFWRFGSGYPYILGAIILLPPLFLVFRLPDPAGARPVG